MEMSRLLGLGLLAVGLLLLRELKKKEARRQTFNGFVFKPTANFIWQIASEEPTIDFQSQVDEELM